MFLILLSTSFSSDDYDYDIQLPEVPSVGDTIRINDGGKSEDVLYRVKARMFDIGYIDHKQAALDGPRVVLHVERLKKSGKLQKIPLTGV